MVPVLSYCLMANLELVKHRKSILTCYAPTYPVQTKKGQTTLAKKFHKTSRTHTKNPKNPLRYVMQTPTIVARKGAWGQT